MNVIFALPGITLIIGLFALFEGLVYHCNPKLIVKFAYKGLISEGIILILGSLAFGWWLYYKLAGWG